MTLLDQVARKGQRGNFLEKVQDLRARVSTLERYLSTSSGSSSGSMHDPVTMGASSAPELTISNQVLTLAAVVSEAEHTAALHEDLSIDHGSLSGRNDDDHTIYLPSDGSRPLTGNLSVSAGITIDGVDISAHVADADAHHVGFVGLSGDTGNAIPDATDRITIGSSNGIVTSAAGTTLRVGISLDTYPGLSFSVVGGLRIDDSIAGNGLSIAAKVLSVGAGDGIDVSAAAVAVDVTDIIDTSYGLTESSNNIRVNLAAPSGLSFTGGALQIDDSLAGNGVVMASKVIALGAPGTLSVSSLNQVQTASHSHAIASSNNPGANASLLASNASGGLTLVDMTLTSDLSTQRVASDLTPKTPDTYDLGSSVLLWRKGYLSELDTLLFAENTITLLGGWFYVPKFASTVNEGVDTTETSVIFGSDAVPPNMNVGDFVIFRASLKVEYMELVSHIGSGTWTVTRNKDGSGANEWPKGAPYANLGQSGDGRIEFNAYDSPRIQLMRQGAAYNAQTEDIRIGDLDGNWGYTATTWGMAIGPYETGYANITLDPTNGIRLRNYNVTILQIKNTDGKGYIVNPLYLDTAGGVFQGTGTFASPSTALKIWNDGGIGRIGGYSGGALQWYADTNGKLRAGYVTLDASGVTINISSAPSSARAYKFSNNDGLYGYTIAGIDYTQVLVSSSSNAAYASMSAHQSNSGTALAFLQAQSSGASVTFEAYAAGGTTAYLYGNGNLMLGATRTLPAYRLTVDGTVGFAEYIYHLNDADTYLRYRPDRITLSAGGKEMLDIVEGTSDYIYAYEDLILQGAFGGYGLTIDSSTGAGIIIDRGGTANAHGLYFRTAGVSDWYIGNYNETDGLYFKESTHIGTVRFAVLTNGQTLINDTANTKNTYGLTINIKSSADEGLSLKSSDVDHGMTSRTETDTFAAFNKASATYGGMLFQGFTEATQAINLVGFFTTDATGKTSTSFASTNVYSRKKSGTNYGNVSTSQNVFCVKARLSGVDRNIAIFGADGDLYLDTVVNTDHWDGYDDGQLLDGLRASLMPDGHALRQRFGEWIDYARPVLEQAGIVHYNADGHHFVATKKLQMLTIDAVRQVYAKTRNVVSEVEQLKARVALLEHKLSSMGVTV